MKIELAIFLVLMSYPSRYLWSKNGEQFPNEALWNQRFLKTWGIESRRIISAVSNPIGSFLKNTTYTQAVMGKFPVNLEQVPQLKRYMCIRNRTQDFQPSKLV
jgi:hypothetical protein